MKRFVVPPAWPSPPRRSWVPPKTWRPDPSWPPPPEGWHFWVDGKGNPVRGPIGQYAGPSRRAIYAGAGALMLFLGVNIWALSALGLFGGDSGDSQAVTVVDDRSPSPTPSSVVAQTTTPPLVPKTTVTPTQLPTQRPTQEPTKTRTTERRTEAPHNPTPTKTATAAKKTPTPTRTSQPPTREELLRQYCIQQGWDPEWCDPSNWPTDPADDPRNGG